MAEALRMQMEVQKQLHQQLEVTAISLFYFEMKWYVYMHAATYLCKPLSAFLVNICFNYLIRRRIICISHHRTYYIQKNS